MTDSRALLRHVVAALARPRRATYRLQLGAALGFDDVGALAPYLAALGVSDAYRSPCFKCGPGSEHGYDVTDHNAFNPAVGSAAGFDRMAEVLAACGLGVILDVVPNHMGIAGDTNPWWLDVLENGPGSPRAAFFDIDWAPVRTELRELREVFDASHELVLRLVGEGKVTGLRVDHPDGLYAPGEYFRRLQEGAVVAVARRLVPDLSATDVEALAPQYRAGAAADPAAAAARPLWVAAEKILTPGESLPEWWVVAGTTGYDFLGSVNGLFVDCGTSSQMTSIYSRFVGETWPMADLSYAAKRLIMGFSMASRSTSSATTSTGSPSGASCRGTSPPTASPARSARSSRPSPSIARTWRTMTAAR
jgi:(1->4)-alpha-D-glucan 1-alpha-D-glucosylmutase